MERLSWLLFSLVKSMEASRKQFLFFLGTINN